ncbi:MAG: tRNA pseudouridine(13) synthase TruD [Promethearchaeota archaeon]
MIKLRDKKELENYIGIEIYSTPEFEGINGLYKNDFKDFIVKEITANGTTLEIRGNYSTHSFLEGTKDRYTTFDLVKVNKDTFEAVRDLSKALKISPKLIKYSGLKDKCSISVQKISIKGNFVKELKKLKIKDIFAKNIAPTKKSVKMGANWGNHFTIILRNIENKENLKESIEKIFKKLTKCGFPNYFGIQRFGQYRPNSNRVGRFLLESAYEKAFNEFITTIYSTESYELQSIRQSFKKNESLEKSYEKFPKSLNYERSMIKHLINNPGDYKGCFETLPNDLKSLLVSAFQSYLFNKMISLRVKKGIPLFKPVKGDVISILDDDKGHITQIKYIYGKNRGKYDNFLEKALKLNRAVIVIPIVGYNTDLNEFPLMKTLLEEIIKQEDISDTIFKSELLYLLEFKGSFRAMMVKPIGLKLIELKDDDLFPGKKKVKIEVSLPKGSYATVLLRELIK